jgi:serine/threonine protein kinase
MPRREGNLENRKTLRYKEDSIDALEKKLMASLAFLHRNGFTHNDVAPKNILYAGTYPKLSWHLSDLGSATKNSPVTHDLKVQKDLLDAGHVIAKMRQTLIDKQEQQKKVNPYLLSIMPEYFRQRSERMGVSPLKPVAPTHADTGEPELKAKKRLVFGRKKAR